LESVLGFLVFDGEGRGVLGLEGLLGMGVGVLHDIFTAQDTDVVDEVTGRLRGLFVGWVGQSRVRRGGGRSSGGGVGVGVGTTMWGTAGTLLGLAALGGGGTHTLHVLVVVVLASLGGREALGAQVFGPTLGQ